MPPPPPLPKDGVSEGGGAWAREKSKNLNSPPLEPSMALTTAPSSHSTVMEASTRGEDSEDSGRRGVGQARCTLLLLLFPGCAKRKLAAVAVGAMWGVALAEALAAAVE